MVAGLNGHLGQIVHISVLEESKGELVIAIHLHQDSME